MIHTIFDCKNDLRYLRNHDNRTIDTRLIGCQSTKMRPHPVRRLDLMVDYTSDASVVQICAHPDKPTEQVSAEPVASVHGPQARQPAGTLPFQIESVDHCHLL